VSDKATNCPHCGYPMNTPTSTKPRVRNGKPTKLPNGFGSIHRLSGKRRNPYRVRKTDKWIFDPVTGKTKQLYITIGYYPTREEAMIALSNYNQNPYDVKTNGITFEEAYNIFLPDKLKTYKNQSSARNLYMAFNHSLPLHKTKLRDIRPAHLENCILSADISESSKQHMKSFYNNFYDWAVSNDLVDKNYAKMMFPLGNPIKPKQKTDEEKNPFTNQEVQWLWENIDNYRFIDVILIQIYGGWRKSELCDILVENVHLDECYIVGGKKTEAGINRIVPIHNDIIPLIQKRLREAETLNSQYLFNDTKSKTGLHFTDNKYGKRFEQIMNVMGSEHNTHDCRRTFATCANKCKIDEHILKKMIGHKDPDIIELYTKRYKEELKKEIDKIIFV
jgi:integrase